MGFFGRKEADAGSPAIVVLHVAGRSDELPPLRYPLGPGEDTVGRDEGCTIQVLDPGISRKQLSIAYDVRRGGFVAADLGSMNGTQVNGRRMSEPTVLVDGDIIELGTTRLVFTSKTIDGEMAAMLGLKRFGERARHTRADEGGDPTESV